MKEHHVVLCFILVVEIVICNQLSNNTKPQPAIPPLTCLNQNDTVSFDHDGFIRDLDSTIARKLSSSTNTYDADLDYLEFYHEWRYSQEFEANHDNMKYKSRHTKIATAYTTDIRNALGQLQVPSIFPSPLPGLPCIRSLTNQTYYNNTVVYYNATLVGLEMRGLEAIYNSTNGAYWNCSSGWNFDGRSDPCVDPWFGVGCSYICEEMSSTLYSSTFCVCAITQLILVYNNLHGTVPLEIEFVSLLQSINLRDNYLYGSIPTTIGRLTRLQRLDLRAGSYSAFNSKPLYLNVYPKTQLSGLVPSEIGNLRHLDILDLSYNALSGPLPQQFGYLSNLKWLVITNNNFTGNITFLQNITELRVVEGKYNMFSGRIPDGIKHLTHMFIFYFHYNQLSGQIPATIGQLTQIWSISLISNCLSRAIPTEIGTLKNLNFLALADNYLTQSIPTEIVNLDKLVILVLFSNKLSGNLPNNIFVSSPVLRVAYLNNNLLSGPIPGNIWSAEKLSIVDLSSNLFNSTIPDDNVLSANILEISFANNFLTGQIPTSLFTNTNLVSIDFSNNILAGHIPTADNRLNHELIYLGLYQNRLTGRIPSEICNFRKLKTLVLFDNLLTGTIPSHLGCLKNLSTLSLGSNKFTGSIPEEVYHLQYLSYFDVSNNSLRGQLSRNVTMLKYLVYFGVSFNRMSGSLSESLRFSDNLQYLFLNGNKLSGKISTTLQSLKALRNIDLSDNSFSGGLDGLFNPIAPISFISIKNNFFIGSIPSQWFTNPNLTNFCAAINCLSNELPNTLCQSTGLSYLNLDGMGSQSACPANRRLLEVRQLPLCIFEMPKLEYLHLSGNKYSGEFQSYTTISSSLYVIDISHNLLKGEIPQSFFRNSWYTFNLGFNKLHGTLSANIRVILNQTIFENSQPLGTISAGGQLISMSVNRLSGGISSTYTNLPSVDILAGNIFDCGIPLPENDPQKIYECGSNHTNQSFYAAVALFFLLALVLLVVYMNVDRFGKGIYLEATKPYITSSLKMVALLLIGLVLASCLHLYYSTHNYLYAWSFSFGYLAGKAATLGLILYLVLVSIVMYHSYRTTRPIHQVERKDLDIPLYETHAKMQFANSHHNELLETSEENVNSAKTVSGKTSRIILTMCYDAASACFSIYVNVMYVLNIDKFSATQLLCVQFALAIFKALYQHVPVIIKNDIVGAIKDSSQLRVWKLIASVDNRIILNFFSIVIAPCIAGSIADSNCYKYLIYPPAAVTSNYKESLPFQRAFVSPSELSRAYYPKIEFTWLVKNLVINTVYYPEFTYSYQCASSLMASYVDVFLYFAIFTGIIIPILRLVVRAIQSHINTVLANENLSNVGTTFYRLIASFTNLPMPHVLSHIHLSFNKLEPECKSDFKTNESHQGEPLNNAAQPIDIKRAVRKSFSSQTFLAQLKIMAVIAFTFGLAFPPLGIAIFISLIGHCYITNIEVEFYISQADVCIRDQVQKYMVENFRRLNEDKLFKITSTASKSTKHHSTVLLILLMCLFMWLFIFDILGDSIGNKTAVWASLLLVAPIPIFAFIADACLKRKTFRANEKAMKASVLTTSQNPLQVGLIHIELENHKNVLGNQGGH